MIREASVARGYQVLSVTSPAQIDGGGVAYDSFDVVLVDLGFGSNQGVDVIRRVRAQAPHAELIVMSASTSLPAAALHSCDLRAFAFVQKAFDLGQLFAAVERAVERRRMNRDNQRLVWELQTINEVAEGIAQSLELDRRARRRAQVPHAGARRPRRFDPASRRQERVPGRSRMSATSTSVRGSMASCARATTSSRTAPPTSSTTCARDCLQDGRMTRRY